MWDCADSYKKDQFAFSYCTIHEMMYKKLEERSFSDFFGWNGYKSYALVGLSSLGLIFFDFMRQEGFEPTYAVERRPASKFKSLGIEIVPPESLCSHGQVDVYVICHAFYYNKIVNELVERGIPESKIVSINDIVFSV